MLRRLYEYFGVEVQEEREKKRRRRTKKLKEAFLPGDIVILKGGVRGVVVGQRGDRVVVYLPKDPKLTPLKLAKMLVEHPDKGPELLAKGKVIRKELGRNDVRYDFSPVHMYLKKRERGSDIEQSKLVTESKGWEVDDGVIVIYGDWLEKELGDSLVDTEERRRLEYVEVLCDIEIEKIGHTTDPSDPRAEPIYGEVWYPWIVYFVWDDGSVDTVNYERVFNYLKNLWGKDVAKAFEELVSGLAYELSGEEVDIRWEED